MFCVLRVVNWVKVAHGARLRLRQGYLEGMDNVELGLTLQRVADAKFVLYRRRLHPELFHIHENRHLERPAYSADIWVMGLSHAVTVQADSRCVTEATTDDLEVLPQNGLVTSFQFRGERDHVEDFDDGMKYILSTQVERMTQNLFHASHRDLVRYASTRGMLVRFAEWAQGDELVPFTFIDYEARDRELHVQSFHVFPADYTILKTQSIVEIGRSPAPSRPAKPVNGHGRHN